jgi:hypothetical protein
MDAQILCTLIARQVDTTKFQIHGLNVVWLIAPTSQELNTVGAIISNYESLAAGYLQEVALGDQAKVLKEQQKTQAIIDNLPSWSQVDAAVTAIANLAEAKTFIRKLSRVVYWLAKNSAD